MRDVGPPQTLNNGVVLLRNSARGHFFLELLLAKAEWGLTIQYDQGAFDETVLEVPAHLALPFHVSFALRGPLDKGEGRESTGGLAGDFMVRCSGLSWSSRSSGWSAISGARRP